MTSRYPTKLHGYGTIVFTQTNLLIKLLYFMRD